MEDHSVNGGLGGAVCELLSEKLPTKVKRIGLREFGESGGSEALYEKYGLSSGGIIQDVKNFLN